MKLLIVDDEDKIRNVITEYASMYEYEFDEASNGLEAISLVNKNDYDCIIMDIMMPNLDGMSAVKEIRKTNNTPVIMLSARSEEYDKLYGFGVGIDDYVTKPFSPKELFARVNAIIKRSAKNNEITKFEGLEIDYEGRNIFVDGEKLTLTQKEYQLLEYLIKYKGIAINREDLLKKVWKYDYLGDDRTIDTHIKMLRNHLGPYKKFIVTLRGFGYKFDEKA